MDKLPRPLAPLEKYNQFILFNIFPNPSNPHKLIKKPIDWRSLHVADPTNPEIWTSFEQASITLRLLGSAYGIGFVLTENDPFFLLDIDNCISSEGMAKEVLELLNIFQGAAVERSSSNRGLHIIGSGVIPAHRSRSSVLENLELYSRLRFVALTGNNAIGDAAFDCSHVLPDVINRYFIPNATSITSIIEWTTEPRTEWNGPKSDNELIERALRSVSKLHVFNNKATFSDLWDANEECLIESYPSSTHGSFDGNRVDAALAQHLAYWTGCNCERIESLMLQSKLVRGKWIDRPQYLRDTILKACSQQKEVCIDKPAFIIPPPPSSLPIITQPEILSPSDVTGIPFLTLEQQKQLFAGCAYVEDEHKVLVPKGKLLKPEQFKVKYSGYVFSLDLTNSKSTTDAWRAFTESQGFRAPRVDSYCFRPTEAPGKILYADGLSYVNTWWPIDVKRKKGDATPFFNHLKKLLPDERDRMYLLSYFAACVQYPGVKFSWCPLIQGVEGNGKSLLIQCVIRAIGKRYVWSPEARELTDKFNNWLYGHLLIVIEEMHVPEHQKEILEAMKTRITSSDLELQQKYTDRKMQEICCNFILTSNYKDAIPRTEDMRRYAIFFTAQQSSADLIRDDMKEDYFINMINWLTKEDGWAITAEVLHTFKIPDEMNPATQCLRAPQTSSTNIAISESRGALAQEIIEAIEQEVIGFRGGWISSHYLNLLLQKVGFNRYSHSKRHELLKSLGYDLHPGLDKGRVNNIIAPDNARSRLYIKRHHPDRELHGANVIAKAYENAQNP